MIAPQILVISVILSVTWGLYLVFTVQDYRHAKSDATRRREHLGDSGRGAVIAAFRRMLVAFCLWLICFSYVFRTLAILMGVGDAITGQVVFFALIGSNLLGSLFALASLWFD